MRAPSLTTFPFFRKAVPYLGLGLLILLAFYPVFSDAFTWEDETVLSNPFLHSLSGLASIWLKPGESILLDYMPLTYTTHWVEYHFWGMQPFGYHVVNLALHLLNACILFFLLRRISFPGAWVAAALFAIHPMQVSSVAWVVQRKDLLYTFWYFLAFWAWMRFEEKPRWNRYLLVFIFFLLAMFSKRMAITFPVTIFIYQWWHSGILFQRRTLLLLPLLLVALPLSYIVPMTQTAPIIPPLVELSALQKFILVGRNLFYYLGKLLWPLEHVPFYPRCSLNTAQPLLYLFPLSILALGGVLWRYRNRLGRGPAAALAFYVAALLPVLGVAYWCLMGRTYVQDHYQYVASIAPFLLVAYCMQVYAPRLFRHADRVFAFILLPPLMLIAQGHAALYHDCETLFAPNLAKYPTVAPEAAHNLALGYFRNNKLVQALFTVNRAIALKSDFPEQWRLKGNILVKMGRLEAARAAYDEALKIEPNDKDTLNSYAVTYIFVENPPNPQPGITILLKALALYPDDFRIFANLGFGYKLLGEKEKALEFFERAVAMDPEHCNAEIQYQYGLLLLEMHQPRKAIIPLRRACNQVPQEPNFSTALHQAETSVQP
jgi:protein O-mannosyl-transferase